MEEEPLHLPATLASITEKFKDIIEKLRGEWFAIMMTIGFNSHFMSSEFAECHSNFNPHADMPQLVFHEIFRCGNTAYFLWFLFTNGTVRVPGLSMEKTANRRRNENVRRLIDGIHTYNKDDLNLYLIRLGGTLPDHTFLVAQINDDFFIMQSFVSSYTFSSKHAFAKIVYPDHFFDMLLGFLYFCEISYNPNTMDLTYSNQMMYKDAEDKLSIYTNIDMEEVRMTQSDRYTDVDFAQMLMMKHTIPAADVRGQFKKVYGHICKGIKQAHASPSPTLTNPDSFYSIFLQNRLLGESRFTMDDLEDVPRFKQKLSAAIGFNGHEFHPDMINIRYGENLVVKFDPRDRSKILSLQIAFKVDINVEKLVQDSLIDTFKCKEEEEEQAS